jgi:hypothetical protein
VYFSKNFRKLTASTLCKGMFEETNIFKRSLENSYALPNINELLCDFPNSNRCLFSAANSVYAAFVFSSITMLLLCKTFLSRDFHFT